ISLLKEKKKPYTIHATAKWNGEEETFSQNVYVYDRPTIIGDDGVIRIGGEVFSPVMGYHIEDFTWDTVAPSGINVVQFGAGGHSEAHLKECDRVLDILDENGMKALFVLYKNMKPAAHPDNIEYAKAYVNRFKDDPRIYAWAVMDEPFSSYESPEMMKLMEDSYTLVRNIDSMHPVHLTDVNTRSPKYCDVHSIDFYSMTEDNQSIYDFITNITSEARGECHVQYIGRTFTFGNDENGIPSTKTVRGYIYRAFEAGVKGIGYFSVSDAVSKSDGSGKTALYDLELENGFSWKGFSDLNNKEVPVLYDIYVQKRYSLFNEYEGGKAENGPYWGTWTDGNVVYLIVHNKTKVKQTISPSSDSANGLASIGECTIERIGGTAEAPASVNDLSVVMEPLDVALYKLTPHVPIDLSKLETKNFKDLTGYDWAAEDIRVLASLGIVNTIGEDRFGPGRNITRGDFAMFLIRTLGLTGEPGESFADVDSDAYFAKEIAIGRALGILKGVDEKKFSPYAEITRQDMMTICYRGLQIAGKETKADMAVLDRFPDKDAIRDYASEAICAMANAGIVKGEPNGNINPLGNTTRAEAAVIMNRILKAF
ncbi:MAG: S-layer homology domain-containing protein, partial [Ruminococcaceae bacterium]|nr:S-layer homology domain-containing protein [Oscillospiraceae bacterium]